MEVMWLKDATEVRSTLMSSTEVGDHFFAVEVAEAATTHGEPEPEQMDAHMMLATRQSGDRQRDLVRGRGLTAIKLMLNTVEPMS